jgi:1,4-dihydroxy-2-naphthoate octaprenyltransferase
VDQEKRGAIRASEHGGRSNSAGRLRWLAIRVRALRAFSFPISVLPVVVATAAVRPITEWDWRILVGSVVGVALLHAAGNLLNDYFDYRSGVDRRETGDEGRPGRLLIRGEITLRGVLVESLVCLALVVPIAVYVVSRRGPGLLWFGAAAVCGLYAYTGPPFQLKYRALGELVIFLVFGPFLMLGAAYAQAGQLEWNVLFYAVPVGLMTTAVLVGNNLRDFQEDQEARIVTLAHVAGESAMRLLYVALVVSSALFLAVLGVIGLAPASLVASPFALILLLRPLASVWRGERVADIDVWTARFETVLLLFLGTVLVISGPAGVAL